MWPMIAAKLGFPSSSGRSDPKISEQIRDFHAKALLPFEIAYISAIGKNFVFNPNNGQLRAMPQQGGRPPMPGDNGNQGQPMQVSMSQQQAQAFISQLSDADQSAIRQSGGQNLLQVILSNFQYSPEQMREHGLPDGMINFVQRNRHLLGRNLMKAPEDAQKGGPQQQPPRGPGHQSPAVATQNQAPGQNQSQQRATPIMPEQLPNMPNGQQPMDFGQYQIQRPGSINVQRPNPAGGMVVPETGNQPIVGQLSVQFSQKEQIQAASAVKRIKDEILKKQSEWRFAWNRFKKLTSFKSMIRASSFLILRFPSGEASMKPQ